MLLLMLMLMMLVLSPMRRLRMIGMIGMCAMMIQVIRQGPTPMLVEIRMYITGRRQRFWDRRWGSEVHTWRYRRRTVVLCV